MKLLFESWRRYLEENKERELLLERINSLSSNKRFVNEILTEIEITDPRRNFPLSENELNKIKNLAGFQGQPDFLGSGSQGSAWQFNDKVLKITADASEAQAAYSIIEKDHPNVYKIFLVARRDKEDIEVSLKHMPYIIVYELLDFSNNAMIDVTENLFHKVKKNNIYYFWEESSLEEAKQLMQGLLNFVNKDPESLGAPEKGRSIIPKLESLGEQMGLDEKEKELLKIFWTFTQGAYNNTLDNPLNVLEHVRKTLSSIKIEYLHQLALGLTWLNRNGVRFTDIKTSNIMEKDDQIAIIDIGYSSVRDRKTIPSLGELINETPI